MRLPAHNLEIPVGVVTEDTDRGTRGRWNNSNKIRFRQGLVEKLGGWILSSFGTENGEADLNTTQQRVASVIYGLGVNTITLATAISGADNDTVWLFDDSLVGGLGGRTITESDGDFVLTASAAVTASIGDAVIIEYPDEFTGGSTVTAGGTLGSTMLTLGSTVNTYLKAGSVVSIDLLGGGTQFTSLLNNLVGGATQITLRDALTDAVAAGSPVRIYVSESNFVDEASTRSFVIRFLANAPAASTQLIVTEAIPDDITAGDIDIRPFQATQLDGVHASTTTMTIDPVTAFAISSVAVFPDGLVILPQFQTQQICYQGVDRALHDWSDLDDQQWLALGTNTKLYVINAGVLFDITPIRSTAVLTDPFTTVLASRTVTVTDVAHGAQEGDVVNFSGVTVPTGGLDLNGEFSIDTIVDADNYEITADFPATSSVTGGGTVTVDPPPGLLEEEA